MMTVMNTTRARWTSLVWNETDIRHMFESLKLAAVTLGNMVAFPLSPRGERAGWGEGGIVPRLFLNLRQVISSVFYVGERSQPAEQ